jgi:hypothetical protein
MNIPGMNPTPIRRLRELKIKESARDGDPPTLPKIDLKNWPKTMDALQDHFSTILGETKAPLAYVIRDEATVPDEVDDPPNNYATPEEEMIRQMPHKDAAGNELPTYQHDRTKVWQALSEMTRDEKCWTYVHPMAGAPSWRSTRTTWEPTMSTTWQVKPKASCLRQCTMEKSVATILSRTFWHLMTSSKS